MTKQQDGVALAEAKTPFMGDLLMGYVLLGMQPITVGALSPQHLSAMETVFLRFSWGAVVIVLLCAVRRRFLFTRQPLLLALRGVLGAVAVFLYFSAVAEVGPARATLLNYTYPLWANVVSFLLGARPKATFWMSLAVATLGVAILLWPAERHGDFWLEAGDIKGLLSAIVAGGSVLVVKKLRQTDDALTIVGAFTAGGLLISFPSVSLARTTQALFSPHLGWAAWGLGLTSFLGHLFFTRGYKGATVEQATVLSLLVPIVASALGILVLGEKLGLRFWIGAFLVVLALAYAARTSAQRESKT